MWLHKAKAGSTSEPTDLTIHNLHAALQTLQGMVSQVQLAPISALSVERPDTQFLDVTFQKNNLLAEKLQSPYRPSPVMIHGSDSTKISGAFTAVGRNRVYSASDNSLFGSSPQVSRIHAMTTSVVVELYETQEGDNSLNYWPPSLGGGTGSSIFKAPRSKDFAYRLNEFKTTLTPDTVPRGWWAIGQEFVEPVAVPKGWVALVWVHPVLYHGLGTLHPTVLRPQASFSQTSIDVILPVIGGHAGTTGTPFVQADDWSVPQLYACAAAWNFPGATDRQAFKDAAAKSISHISHTVSDRAIPTWAF